jgi:hypothetical protein
MRLRRLEMQSLFLCACNDPSGGDGNRINSISDPLHVDPGGLCAGNTAIASSSLWTSPSAKAGVLPTALENLSVLTSRAGFMAKTPFSVSQENSIRIAAMWCFTVAGAA